MSAKLWESSNVNAVQSTLDGTIDDAVTTISLVSTTGLVAPGVLVIDRQDGSGNDTPTKREYITFTGISSNDLTGVTREVAGSTAQAHSSGALIEAIPSATHWGDMVDFLQVEHDSVGKHLISTATITYTETKRLAVTSLASIAQIKTDSLSASNYVDLKGVFDWAYSGALATSLVTAERRPFWRATKNMTLTGVWAGLVSAPSLNAFQGDIEYCSTPNGTFASIFSTKPTIDIGEYRTDDAATPAVLSLTSLASGTILQPEVEHPGDGGILLMELIGKERA